MGCVCDFSRESATDVVGPRPDPFNPPPGTAVSVPTHFFDESSLAYRELPARETIPAPHQGKLTDLGYKGHPLPPGRNSSSAIQGPGQLRRSGRSSSSDEATSCSAFAPRPSLLSSLSFSLEHSLQKLCVQEPLSQPRLPAVTGFTVLGSPQILKVVYDSVVG